MVRAFARGTMGRRIGPSWVSFGGDMYIHFLQSGDRISDVTPLTLCDGKNSRISIYICVLRSFLLDLSGPHVLTLF